MAELNVAGAVEFFEFVFGESPNGIILTRRMHPDPPKGQENDPKYNKASHWTRPIDLEKSPTWQEQAAKWNCFFSTCSVKTKESPRKDGEYVECPVLWFDLDALKQLPIRADDVYQELMDQGDLSCLVRSSEKGIQGFFKLDEPIQLNGKKATFNEILKPILHNIAYYYGGDLAVCTVGNYMRIPGTCNVKKQYAEPYKIRAKYIDKIYGLGALKQKFPTDPHVCPFPVWYGLASLAEEVWENGMRHQFAIGFCGTLRRSGIDRESCKNALVRVFSYLKHESIDGEVPTVDSTYDLDLAEPGAKLQTLYSEFPDIAKKAEAICEWWVKYKQGYCKKVGIHWRPENYDPREDPNKPTGTFWEDNMQTYYMAAGKDGPYEKLFANFAIRMKGKLFDPVAKTNYMVGDIVTAGQITRLIEMPTSLTSTSWDRFCTIENLPSGIACFDRSMWQEYVGYLSQQNIDKPTKVKVRYYGFFDVDTKPTLVLPNVDHPTYTWLDQGTDTTLEPEQVLSTITVEDKIEYLTRFAEHYPHYHEPRYIFPALGWFSAAPMSAFLRHHTEGFPVLLIRGMSGSGKSTLIDGVLGPHFGLNTPTDFGASTHFAMSRMLTANNIYPALIEEFRDKNENKVAFIEGLIRPLWDGLTRDFGTGGKNIRKESLIAPLCIVGEHSYTDEAALHRTYRIQIDREWINQVREWEEDAKVKGVNSPELAALIKHRTWLENARHRGMMVTILVQWITENYDLIPEIIENAKTLVEETSPIPRGHRKNDGFVSIISGILLLKTIYSEYGLKFFLTRKALLDALYTADTQLHDFETYDTDTFRTLFQKTDFLIIDTLSRTGKTPEGKFYHFDVHDPDVVHFDIGRWHSSIESVVRKTASAALAQMSTFRELLIDSTKDDESVVLGFGKSKVFRDSVAISLSRVAQKYWISTDQWKNIEQLMDEAEG